MPVPEGYVGFVEANGCAFLREGGRHTVYFTPTSG
jgi:hypothetical protein